jgi:hypothetical protein
MVEHICLGTLDTVVLQRLSHRNLLEMFDVLQKKRKPFSSNLMNGRASTKLAVSEPIYISNSS